MGSIDAREAFVTRYRALLATGHAANPPPERRPRQRGRVKQMPVRTRLERLWLGQDEVLAFLDDLTILIDNNQAQRDLRMLNVQQKVCGSFRSDRGADAFACLRRYLSTRRQARGGEASSPRNRRRRSAALPRVRLNRRDHAYLVVHG